MNVKYLCCHSRSWWALIPDQDWDSALPLWYFIDIHHIKSHWFGLRFLIHCQLIAIFCGIFIHLRCSVGCSTTLLIPTPESSSGQPFGHAWLSSLRGPAWKQANPPIRRWNRSLKVTKTLERSFWTSNIQFGAVVHWDLNSTTQYDVAWHSTC